MRLRARHAVVPVIAALVLVGCTRPGTAAIVDGERITDAQLAEVNAELARIGVVELPQATLTRIVQAEPAIEIAEAAGIGYSESEARSLLDATAERAGGETFDYGPQVLRIAQATMANGNADPETQAEIEVAWRSVDVEMNPRLGTWNGGVEPTTWPWIIATPSAG